MADYKERDDFPEVPDYKITIGDNLDGGLLSASDIYSPKSEPALIDNVLDPSSEDMLKEIVVLIDEFGKKTLKKSFTKELRVGNSMGSTDGTNASVLKTGKEKEEEVEKAGPPSPPATNGGSKVANWGKPRPTPAPEAAVIKSISKFLRG